MLNFLFEYNAKNILTEVIVVMLGYDFSGVITELLVTYNRLEGSATSWM